ncbi:MAG: hypothetical protein IJU01_04570 [Lachnospiraceae bacterium]|nr:hypothetical protein [Lachnospiraceae bacterium]
MSDHKVTVSLAAIKERKFKYDCSPLAIAAAIKWLEIKIFESDRANLEDVKDWEELKRLYSESKDERMMKPFYYINGPELLLLRRYESFARDELLPQPDYLMLGDKRAEAIEAKRQERIRVRRTRWPRLRPF